MNNAAMSGTHYPLDKESCLAQKVHRIFVTDSNSCSLVSQPTVNPYGRRQGLSI